MICALSSASRTHADLSGTSLEVAVKHPFSAVLHCAFVRNKWTSMNCIGMARSEKSARSMVPRPASRLWLASALEACAPANLKVQACLRKRQKKGDRSFAMGSKTAFTAAITCVRTELKRHGSPTTASYCFAMEPCDLVLWVRRIRKTRPVHNLATMRGLPLPPCRRLTSAACTHSNWMNITPAPHPSPSLKMQTNA